ncbi:MAG: hypothetical protein JSV03_03390, partial [Planctomycetota bacterium]
SYHTWMWEGLLIRNEVVYSGAGPEPDMGGTGSGPRDGRPQYSALSWCYAKWGTAANKSEQYDQLAPPGSGQPPKGNKNAKMHNRHRKWALGDVRRVKSSSMSDVTVSFCFQGTNMGFKGHDTYPIIRNPRSHRIGKGSGTNAIFGDTHVEWVKGYRIGWQ